MTETGRNRENRYAFVVPTKDRPNDLTALLDSLRAQTVLPNQIIIVDGSDPDIRSVVDKFSDLPIDYVREFPPSLARQRNAGMARLRDDITIAGYLDDDIVMLPDAMEKMKAFWGEADETVGGAVFAIICDPPGPSRLSGLFGFQGGPVGGMSDGGVEHAIHPVAQTCETRWLNGGSTLWRRNVIDKYAYDEWYIGHGFLEDVDYSFRVGKKYRLFAIADANVYHNHHPITLNRMFAYGRQQMINRVYFVRKMKCFKMRQVVWQMIGQMALNLVSSLHEGNSAGLRRFLGNVSGLFAVLIGRKTSFGEVWK